MSQHFQVPSLCFRLSSSSHRETEVCPGLHSRWDTELGMERSLPALDITELSYTPLFPHFPSFSGAKGGTLNPPPQLPDSG